MSKSPARVSSRRRAVFEDAHTLRLGDRRDGHGEIVLIATGGAPNHGAAIPGIEHVISSNEAFHLPALPKRIVIQGGGYIALEFACIFAGFGSDVTVVYRGDNILRGFDEDVRAHVRSEMEKKGITILTGCTVDKVDKHGKEFTSHLSNGSSIASDQVMFAIGRHPTVANLGLEKAGVAINPREWRHRGRRFLAHLRAEHLRDRRRHPSPQPDAGGDPRGPCLCRHACSASGRSRSIIADIPTAVFSQPEVGTVGLTEAAGARAVQPRRYLQGDIQADEGDDVGPRYARC